MSKIVRIDNTKTSTGIILNKDDFPDYVSYKKEYDRQYAVLKRERRRQIYKLNSEYKANQMTEYRKKNPEMFNQRNKKRTKNYKEKGYNYKNVKLYQWKRAGIKIQPDTFDRFVNAKVCELCNKKFKEDVGGKTQHNTPCLEHDHLSGAVRSVCCITCNNYMKRYDNLRLKVCLEIHRYKNINDI